MVPTYNFIEHAFFIRSLIISPYAGRTNYFWIVSNIMYFTTIIHYILHYCIGFESVSVYLVITGWEEANFSWEAWTEHRKLNIFPQTVQPNLTIKVFFTVQFPSKKLLRKVKQSLTKLHLQMRDGFNGN